ncbi:efflux RND transporter periplasmic adaptor subunit [Candidatus Dependentiae bacterium]|nr:efflux RND transporter periplasmic adaptor subunit [Candidatus Dependentiae bacterium]
MKLKLKNSILFYQIIIIFLTSIFFCSTIVSASDNDYSDISDDTYIKALLDKIKNAKLQIESVNEIRNNETSILKTETWENENLKDIKSKEKNIIMSEDTNSSTIENIYIDIKTAEDDKKINQFINDLENSIINIEPDKKVEKNEECKAGDAKNIYEGFIFPYNEIAVTSKVSGFIKQINLKEGQFVSINSMICEIDDKKLLEDIKSSEYDLKKLYLDLEKLKSGKSESELEKLKIAVNISKRNYEDALAGFAAEKLIFENNGMSEKEFLKKKNQLEISKLNFDKSELDIKIANEIPRQIDLDIAEHNISKKNFDIDRMKEKLKYIKIYSPVSGYAKDVVVRENDYISESGKLAVIIDISNVYAEFLVSKETAEKSMEKKNVRVYVDALNKNIGGEIISAYPEFESSEYLFHLKILIDNNDFEIKPGMKVILYEAEFEN